MTVAVSKAIEEGAEAVIVASTGNTASSVAAYAARAGIPAVDPPAAGSGRLGQAGADAHVRRARPRGARQLRRSARAARELAGAGHARARQLDQPVPPPRSEDGRVRDRRGARRQPGRLYLPYGGGGNTNAYGQGLDELGRSPRGSSPPRPPTAATPSPRRSGSAKPVHAPDVAEAIERTHGEIVTVTDEEILAAWQDLARTEGLFCEPASAAGLAALARDRPERGSTVVCVITGHGLKDPMTAERMSPPLDPGRSRSRRDRGGIAVGRAVADSRPRAGDHRQPRLRASTARQSRSTSGTSSR